MKQAGILDEEVPLGQISTRKSPDSFYTAKNDGSPYPSDSMVAGVIIGAVIGAVSSLIGAFGTGYLNIRQAKVEQRREDNRLVAESIVSQEAESMRELSFMLNKLDREYQLGVMDASQRILTKSEYQEEYRNQFQDLQDAIDRATAFLSEDGEQILKQYSSHLIDAEFYMRRNTVEERELPREGEVKELLREDGSELDWDKWRNDYLVAKNALRDSINANLRLLSNRE